MTTFSLQSLRQLFLAPRSFFQNQLDGATRHDLLVAAYLVGISAAQGRLDRQLIKLDLGTAPISTPLVSIANSWLLTWLLLLGVGALSGVFVWYIGNWWYRVRLGWAGAKGADSALSRSVFLHAGIVAALPSLLLVLLQTVLYPSYLAAWQAEELWSATFVIFPFWAVWVSYCGVRTRFDTSVWGARIWFLILPLLVYSLVFGLLGFAYSLVDAAGSADAAV